MQTRKLGLHKSYSSSRTHIYRNQHYNTAHSNEKESNFLAFATSINQPPQKPHLFVDEGYNLRLGQIAPCCPDYICCWNFPSFIIREAAIFMSKVQE
jgi:hypothetical protein